MRIVDRSKQLVVLGKGSCVWLTLESASQMQGGEGYCTVKLQTVFEPVPAITPK